MSRRSHGGGDGAPGVQLGLIITPMLDMAFQILSFFIMTYHPSALEAHIPGSLVPPEDYAKKSKDNTPMAPQDPLLSLAELPDPALAESITIKIKSILKGQGIEGDPAQLYIKKGMVEAEYGKLADTDVDFKTAMKRLDSELKVMIKNGANKANIKISADGDLRQQYIIDVYDTCKRAGFVNIHFVPPPVLNTKIKS